MHSSQVLSCGQIWMHPDNIFQLWSLLDFLEGAKQAQSLLSSHFFYV